MKLDRRLIAALAALGLLMAAWLGLTVAWVGSVLDAPARDALAGALTAQAPLVVVTWAGALGVAALALRAVHRRFVVAPARLAEEAQVLIGTDAEREIEPRGSHETRALAGAFNALARQRASLRRDVERQVREASRSIEQERNRLAALMSELTESVVVCGLDGRVILYNGRARAQFRALSQAPGASGGTELIGLGRSIYAVLDERRVAHALEDVAQRMRRGEASPSAQFVTTLPSGQLLRVQMAPVRGAAQPAAAQEPDAAHPAEPSASQPLAGFVLMLDDITREFEDESARDRLMNGLTQGIRSSLASLQAAVDMLEYPDLDAAMRERFQRVIHDEVRVMSRRLQDLVTDATDSLKTRWPLQDMLAEDLVSAALKRIEALGTLRAGAAEIDAGLWLRVDSFSLLQALTYLAGRLGEELGLRGVRLRAQPAGAQRAHLDLIWSGQPISNETAMSWELDPMRIGTELTALTVRDVVERHGGEFWFERERVRHELFFRFLLPRADAAADAGAAAGAQAASAAGLRPGDARPEYYDFDLFQPTEQARAFEDRKLAELAYTVFDTETTGLDPLQGDEIIQIGAARIVNGRLLRHECFEQLIDPRRPIPQQSIPIHGIGPEMVRGQPTIEQVLPAFHAFARDTVLVAHNAAFDMRFVQMKQQRAGVRFDQPVLDTLLLSALVHPNQESHRLEALAERFGVAVTGRHTALGDALVTAEIFLKMVPLLAQRGIHTLGQAREAAQQTFLARVGQS